MEIMPGEERDAGDAGLVVVYGYSDDNVELRGATDYEDVVATIRDRADTHEAVMRALKARIKKVKEDAKK